MRLLDRILWEGFRVSDRLGTAMETILLQMLGRAKLLMIDNVANYYYSIPRRYKPGEEIEIADFPNVMLPLDIAFLEMRIPSFVREDPAMRDFEEVGFLMELRTDTSGRSKKRFGSELYLCAFLFCRHKTSSKVLCAAEFYVPVDTEGRMINPTEGKDKVVPLVGRLLTMEPARTEHGVVDLLNFLQGKFLLPALLAISFMHCKNVKVSEQIPPPKLSKKHERKHGRPLLVYRVLQIDHMKEVLEREGGASERGLKRALHICRGHFKHYGKDGKGLLFGKHSATVWVSMHTRGDAEEGVVAKDYDVK